MKSQIDQSLVFLCTFCVFRPVLSLTNVFDHFEGVKTTKLEFGFKPRPLIVNFYDFNDRVAVKAGRKNIPTGCDIGISDDLPLAIRAARRRLHSELERYKSQNRDSYILYPAKLYVDGNLVREEPIRAEDNVRRKDSREPRPRSRREGDVRREGRRDYSSRRDDSRYRHDDSRDRSRYENSQSGSGRDGAWRHPRHSSRRFRNGYNGQNNGYP